MEKGILIMVLTGAHYIYIIFMVIILITMILKKESVVPCVLGIFFLGLFFTKNIVGALNGVFNSFVVALNELGGIILIIGIMVALSKALEENHAIDFMVKPFSKVIKKYITDEKFLDFEFFENADGKLKKHSTISKKARGMMLNFITKNKIENIEGINFLRRLNEVVYKNIENPIVIAEESTSWPMVTAPTYLGGLGFSYKWNMGWMNDTLKYMELDPIYRKYHHDLITFSFMYAFSENFILPLSHDEVVHGKKSLLDKMSGDEWQRFASLRLLYSYYMVHPGKKLLFMGSEFGQGLEWRYAYGLEWELLEREQHIKMKDFVRDLNYLYKDEKSLYEIDNSYEGFDFIDPHNEEQSIVTLMRKCKDENEFLICVLNFTPVVHYDYNVGVPYLGEYEEIFNSDDEKYWGSNQTMKKDTLHAIDEKWHNKPYHIRIKVPPLGATFIKMKKRYKGNV